MSESHRWPSWPVPVSLLSIFSVFLATLSDILGSTTAVRGFGQMSVLTSAP